LGAKAGSRCRKPGLHPRSGDAGGGYFSSLLTAFFAVWTVHHDCETNPFQARTIRGKIKSFLTYSMFFHVEHHLFPAVPTCKLKILAERLDMLLPGVGFKKVI
jgi:fatty acid desaturase